MTSLPGTKSHQELPASRLVRSMSLPACEAQRAFVLTHDEALLGALRGVLEHLGYQVEHKCSLEELMGSLPAPQEEEILLLISPGVVGAHLPGLLKWVRSLPVHPQIPTVLLPSAQRDVAEVALTVGADDCIEAPLRSSSVLARLKKVQQMHRMRRELHHRTMELRLEFETAQKLQRSMLPRGPVSCPGVDVAWSYEPHGFVAGDMFNLFSLAEGIHGAYVADVCGHGIAAAMLSSWLAHTLQPAKSPVEGSARTTSDAFQAMLLQPAYTCAFLESQLSDMKHELYITLFYMLIDTSMRQLRYTRCGHPYPIILRPDGEVFLLRDGDGPAIGMGLGLPFQEGEYKYQPGERLFLFSDGLLEATSPDGECFGVERCMQHLRNTRSCSIGLQRSSLIDAARRFQGRRHFDDDLTLLGLSLQ